MARQARTRWWARRNDVYIVENIADVIEESPAEGFDVAQSSVTFALADGVEDLTPPASGVGAAGNDLANKLWAIPRRTSCPAPRALTLDGGAGMTDGGSKDDDPTR
jgi:hypothetical protein